MFFSTTQTEKQFLKQIGEKIDLMIYFCVGLGLFSIASGDFLDVSGDDLTMMPRMEPDLNKYIPKRGRATPCLRLIYYICMKNWGTQ